MARPALQTTTPPAGTWQPLGPSAIGPSALASGLVFGTTNSGRVTGVVQLPATATHPGRIVIASAGGGIWTSDDGGTTWTPRTDGQLDLAMGALTLSATNPNHLVAGTGEDHNCQDCYAGDGILDSTDGGSTWTLQNPRGVFTGTHVAQVAVDPTNDAVEYAATDRGLFVTTDGGQTWAPPTDTNYSTEFPGGVTAVTVDSTGTVWIASGSDQAGTTGQWLVARSSDHGAIFTEADTGIALPATSPSFVALAVAPSATGTAYASIGQSGASEKVALWKTTDGGQSWTQLTNAPDYTGGAYSYGDGPTDTSEQGAYDNVVAVDPTDPNRVIAGGIALVQSDDGGSTWSNVNGAGFITNTGTNLLHPDMHALYFTNGKVLVGNDGGIWLYDPSTKQVTDLNGNLDITQFYPGFSVMNGELLAGAQDNATALYMGKPDWTGIWSGDGGPSALVPNDPNMAFFQADQAVAVTTDGFQTLNQLNSPSAVPPNFTVPLQVVPNSIHPTAPSLYVGWGDGLYVTSDPADATVKWKNLTPNEGHGSVSALAVSGATIYVGFDDGTVMASTDGGSTFTTASQQPYFGTADWVTGISIDPTNADTMVASFSTHATRSNLHQPHIAQYDATTDTWTAIGANGLSSAVSKVIYDGTNLIAATDNGVYTSTDGGNSWSATGTGMPAVQVQDVQLTSTGDLYALTHGRGAWMLPGTPATSTTYTWAGGDTATSDKWSDPNNWSGAQAPPAGIPVSLVFPAAACTASATCTSVDDIAGLVAQSVTITEPTVAGTTPPTGYSLTADTNNDPLTIQGGITTVSPPQGRVAGAGSITIPVSLGAAASWNISDSLSVANVTGPANGSWHINTVAGSHLSLATAETGAVTIAGPTGAGAAGGTVSVGADLNGANTQPVNVTDATLSTISAQATFGPVATTAAQLALGGQPGSYANPVTTGDIFDAASTLAYGTLTAPKTGNPVGGTDFPSLAATGNIALNGVRLAATADCNLPLGDTFGLVSAAAVTGMVTDQNGQALSGGVYQPLPATDGTCGVGQMPRPLNLAVSGTAGVLQELVATVVAPPTTVATGPTGINPPAGATDVQTGISTAPGGTAAATSGNVTSTASNGTGEVLAAQYPGDPEAGPTFYANGGFFDTEVSSGNTFTSVQIKLTGTALTGDGLYWFDPVAGQWDAVTGDPGPVVSPDGSTLTVTLDANSSPTLAQLTGTVFAAGKPKSAGTGPGTPGSGSSAGTGYRMTDAAGDVTSFGLPDYGSLAGTPLARPVVGIATDVCTGGYWLAASDGGVFAFHAPFEGSLGGVKLDAPIVGIAPYTRYDSAGKPTACGYWLVASDGGVFAFNAPFAGSTGGIHLNQPVVGVAADPATGGYWLVASDGGVFAFNAPFAGSTGGIHLNQPVVGMAADPATGGYWLVASDGGVFAFNAPFAGSTGGIRLASPVTGMAAPSSGTGYWLVGADGGVFSFGTAPFEGSVPGSRVALRGPVTGFAAG